ncbi:YycH family regulatory protein [Ornithinibacillus contaminans]|uniref:YycH family regulatory protein n=1 Tax=Ornithinibacillus contaminans TaxID=694055 RepID=UPI00064DA1B4|nr:two-component system activity regulator YycH [Ornithinibacillus contaminans]
MNIEVIKSYTLAILVGISLILTFSLWSYQPYEENADDDDLVDEIDLGGVEETKKTLVRPSTVMFNKYQYHFGFTNPADREKLYEDMQTWVLYNVRSQEASGPPDDQLNVEVVFPEVLPLEIISSLFTLNNVEELSTVRNFSFQRMYITLETDNSVTFSFLSTDGQTQVVAEANNSQKHELLTYYFNTLDGLTEYTELEESDYPIYVPIGEPEMSGYTVNIEPIDPNLMKNALFFAPDAYSVIENVTDDNEMWYQDGQRSMRIFPNRISMEYVNPQENSEPLGKMDLLDRSIASINGYKGWMRDFGQSYRLESINTPQNFIRYQMYYNSYPVFNGNNLASIEQLWIDNELSEYRRPLYTIFQPFEDNFELEKTGSELIKYLKNNSIYEIEQIEDIQLGYRLSYSELQGSTFSLYPSWLIKVNGEWAYINFDETNHSKGVS